MVNEVESILREIRERVQAEEDQNGSAAARRSSQPGDVSAEVFDADEIRFAEVESLARVSSHLTTTARTWDKLPPLFSNRKGGAARFELWIKARLKVMSRWFTWEQVNFNSAVHHALTDALQALSAQTQELGRLRAALERESASRESETITLQARGRAMESHVADLNARLADLAKQLSESQQRLHDQQRVCFQQLSLEVSEAASLEDRGRRVIESRLDNLEQASNGEE